MEYEVVIGLEVHVQLLTETKLFCSCRNQFTHSPNTNVCPVCLGHPGVLPVLNKNAFELGMKAALAINCEIAQLTKFDRKHYYYPDLPKNFQTSQYDMPLGEHGYLDVCVDGEEKRIGITRAHMEEDAGKLVHGSGDSSVDLNRTGTPLIEIVSEPDIRTPAEARAYLELLRLTMRYAGVSDCNMEEGSLRCDANVSVRPMGQTELGTKNEIKNMNSFRAVEAALEMVIADLIEKSDNNETIRQVTWGYSIDQNRIFEMRVKEDANDYRYFPEPDLPAVTVAREWVERVKATLPELPRAKQARFMSEYELSDYDTGVLVQDLDLAEYFEATAKASSAAKDSANWVINNVVRVMNEQKITAAEFPVSAGALAELIGLVNGKVINMPTARDVFSRLVEQGGGSAKEIVEKEGLAQVSDTGAIEAALEEAIAANPKAAEDIENGKPATAMFFVGKIMQAMRGKADPEVVGEVIASRFGIDPALLQKKKKKKD